jgi:integrase
MAWADVPNFLRELEAREGTAAFAFRFLILTACRTSEVLNTRWAEIDFDNFTWTIPAERMKARREQGIAAKMCHGLAHHLPDFASPGPAGTKEVDPIW